MRRAFLVLTRAVCGLVCLAALGLAVCVFARFPFSYDRERLTALPQPSTLVDREGRAFAVPGLSSSLTALPDHVAQVFIAAEDARFPDHAGVDVVRIFGSLLANLKAGERAQGASTITQQLVKNRLLSSEKTYERKALEAVYALQAEQDLSKDQILLLYLESAYFGKGATGLSQAAFAYFSKEAGELTLVEAAALAATLRAPSRYAPHQNPERNRQRRAYIFGEMAELGYLSETEAEEAAASPLVLTPGDASSASAWFADAALDEAAALLHIDRAAVETGGYRIETTMDAALQGRMAALASDPQYFPGNAADGSLCQTALCAVEPGTGETLALIGGRSYAGGLNRATEMWRQPGSALKPFSVYAPAFERRGVEPGDWLLDAPADFDGYAPSNYGDRYYGIVTVRTAAALSLNVPAVKLLEQIGGGQAARYSLMRFGLEPDRGDEGLSLAVGSMERGVSPLRLCAAYASLAAGGDWVQPHLVRRILDGEGKVVALADFDSGQAASPQAAYLTYSLLQSSAQWGTGKAVGAAQPLAAAKTGTVDYDGDRNRDAWCAAVTDRLALCCWLGFDRTDGAHSLPSATTGGAEPAALLAALLQGSAAAEVPLPPGLAWGWDGDLHFTP